MLSPTVDELAETYAKKIDVVKCNVDDCQEIAMEYGIRSIPTLLFFKNGEVVERTVGAVPRQEIVDIIEKL
jgi:thioredoxin 1